jgi:hypothetical protein
MDKISETGKLLVWLTTCALVAACGEEAKDESASQAEPDPTTIMAPPIDVGDSIIDDGASTTPAAPATPTTDPSGGVVGGTEESAGDDVDQPHVTCSSPLELSGTLDGSPFSVTWGRTESAATYDTGAAFVWVFHVGEYTDHAGALIVYGDEPVTADSPEDALEYGQTLTLSGGVLIPPQTDGAQVHCIGSGSTITRDEATFNVEFTGMKSLGSCPGAAADGALEVCYGISVCDGSYGGTLEGQSVTINRIFGGSLYGWELYGDDLGLMRWLERGDGEAETGIIDRGLILTHASGPFGGAIYCMNEGSWANLEGETLDGKLFTLGAFSLLGSCVDSEPGTDSLTGCFNALD